MGIRNYHQVVGLFQDSGTSMRPTGSLKKCPSSSGKHHLNTIFTMIFTIESLQATITQYKTSIQNKTPQIPRSQLWTPSVNRSLGRSNCTHGKYRKLNVDTARMEWRGGPNGVEDFVSASQITGIPARGHSFDEHGGHLSATIVLTFGFVVVPFRDVPTEPFGTSTSSLQLHLQNQPFQNQPPLPPSPSLPTSFSVSVTKSNYVRINSNPRLVKSAIKDAHKSIYNHYLAESDASRLWHVKIHLDGSRRGRHVGIDRSWPVFIPSHHSHTMYNTHSRHQAPPCPHQPNTRRPSSIACT
ncbi:unnamed protein product [Nesidiocoris tenuis]|uniref:Uncharacterized protein n=1 Tax=Nesidiocoris tenuis TaxID=355587 RepID=A0A6H5HEZ3_9HEMI|nr:unnamed protein product [Nesidiocoris tenuis]